MHSCGICHIMSDVIALIAIFDIEYSLSSKSLFDQRYQFLPLSSYQHGVQNQNTHVLCFGELFRHSCQIVVYMFLGIVMLYITRQWVFIISQKVVSPNITLIYRMMYMNCQLSDNNLATVDKNNCTNMSTRDLVLKITSRLSQR